MNARTIEQVCRRSKEIYVYRRGDADFVGDSAACYLAPWARDLRPSDLLGMFGVPVASQSGYDLLERAADHLLNDAPGREEVPAKLRPYTLNLGGEEYVPLAAGEAIWLVRVRHLSPFGRDMSRVSYFVRPDADGFPRVAVKQGMLLQALIEPLLPGDETAKALLDIAEGVARAVEYLDTCGTGSGVPYEQEALAV